MLARHISIYLASELTSYSLSEIGKVMNGKDHTTIMYSVEKIKSIMETDEFFFIILFHRLWKTPVEKMLKSCEIVLERLWK